MLCSLCGFPGPIGPGLWALRVNFSCLVFSEIWQSPRGLGLGSSATCLRSLHHLQVSIIPIGRRSAPAPACTTLARAKALVAPRIAAAASRLDADPLAGAVA